MTWDHGCELFMPCRNPERTASILRQAIAWHRGGSVTVRIGDVVHYVF